MEHIRIKASIHLNRHHALTERDLETLKPALERAMAGALPDSIKVDTVTITNIKEASPHDENSKSGRAPQQFVNEKS
jgi:hypothetical protein